MKDISTTLDFSVEVHHSEKGILTHFTSEFGINNQASLSTKDGKLLLANYLYDKKKNYQLIYTLSDTTGHHENFVESEGILPSLFLSPQGDAYVSLIVYHADKEQEISIPIFQRENIKAPKAAKPFVGEYIGISASHSIFYDVDLFSEKKPDKLLSIKFLNGKIQNKKSIKVPLPKKNKIYIHGDEIHLLARQADHWLHRQITPEGEIIKERIFHSDHFHYRQVLKLSFDEDSLFLAERLDGELILDTLSCKGEQIKSKSIYKFGFQLFNTWPAVKLASDSYIIQFNAESACGWLCLKNNELTDIFYSQQTGGFKNLLSSEQLHIKDRQCIISAIKATSASSYAVIFYDQKKNKSVSKDLWVWHRAL